MDADIKVKVEDLWDSVRSSEACGVHAVDREGLNHERYDL